jgi:hypothetical protein
VLPPAALEAGPAEGWPLPPQAAVTTQAAAAQAAETTRHRVLAVITSRL